jgi:hypothetical protein
LPKEELNGGFEAAPVSMDGRKPDPLESSSAGRARAASGLCRRMDIYRSCRNAYIVKGKQRMVNNARSCWCEVETPKKTHLTDNLVVGSGFELPARCALGLQGLDPTLVLLFASLRVLRVGISLRTDPHCARDRRPFVEEERLATFQRREETRELEKFRGFVRQPLVIVRWHVRRQDLRPVIASRQR